MNVPVLVAWSIPMIQRSFDFASLNVQIVLVLPLDLTTGEASSGHPSAGDTLQAMLYLPRMQIEPVVDTGEELHFQAVELLNLDAPDLRKKVVRVYTTASKRGCQTCSKFKFLLEVLTFC
jgi:hypothetical protein